MVGPLRFIVLRFPELQRGFYGGAWVAQQRQSAKVPGRRGTAAPARRRKKKKEAKKKKEEEVSILILKYI
jgi:hypothetical protein